MNDTRLSFLGAEGLTALRESIVSIAGVGGGGSHIAQQLAHLGVGTINLLDHDVLEPWNLDRVVGSTSGDIGRLKVEIVRERYGWARSNVIAIPERIESAASIEALQSSDFVFGAVDRFRVRDDLERVSRQALVPYIDVGLGIRVTKEQVTSAAGQVVLSSPGRACLRCMEVIDEINLARDKEEYVETGEPDQQVISMNGVLASEAVNIFICLVTGYARRYQIPRYLTYNALLHELKPHPFFGFSNEACNHYPIKDAGDQIATN